MFKYITLWVLIVALNAVVAQSDSAGINQQTPSVSNTTPTETISYADEMALYMEALALPPDLIQVIKEAHAAWREADYTLASTMFDEAERLITDEMPQAKGFLELNRGLLALDQKQFDEALVHYQKAARSVPNWWLIEAHIAEAETLKQGDVPIEAVALEPSFISVPLLSACLLVVGLLFVYLAFRNRRRLLLPLSILLVAGAALAYPTRFDVPNPFGAKNVPSSKQAADILDSVLTNTYRAFTFEDEEDIYDHLAISIIGDTLREIYLQNRASVQIQAAGGTTMRIDDVKVLGTSAITPEANGFNVKAQWQVSGFVRHYGHLHYRRNAYEAIITLVVNDNTWKISNISLIQQEQLL